MFRRTCNKQSRRSPAEGRGQRAEGRGERAEGLNGGNREEDVTRD
jgi:hypothetical protein